MDKIAPSLPVLSELEVLDVGHNNIDDQAAIHLAEALRHTRKLKTLNLAYNNIGPIGMEALSKALRSLKSLEVLNLFVNDGLGDDGVLTLANVVSQMTSLRELWVNETNCGNEGLRQLAAAVPPTLELLNIANNMDLTDEVVPDLVEMQKRLPRCICFNNMGRTNITEEAWAPVDAVNQTLYKKD